MIHRFITPSILLLILVASNRVLGVIEVEYSSVEPSIQLAGKPMVFSCIVRNHDVDKVYLTIVSPNGLEFMRELIWVDSTGKYVNTSFFYETGNYSFFISIIDYRGVKITTQPSYFWVTKSLDDIDDDGIPNQWENLFHLNPLQPWDARFDYDRDGYTNLEEYQLGGNPWIRNPILIKVDVSTLAIYIMLAVLSAAISMRFRRETRFIVILITPVLILSILDILFTLGLIYYLIPAYILLLLLGLLLSHRIPYRDYVKLFEKTLQGELRHFKCRRCGGVFAIKESIRNGGKPLIMTCPNCGGIGWIPTIHSVTTGVIPAEKSGNISFICKVCGESLTIWSEGGEIHPQTKVYSCPFCGSMRLLRRVSKPYV